MTRYGAAGSRAASKAKPKNRVLQKSAQRTNRSSAGCLLYLHRQKKRLIRFCRDTDMDVLLVDNFFFLHVDAGIELGKYFESRGANFQRDGRDRHLAASFFGLGCEAGPQ